MRQALRSNPWSFAGPAATQGVAAALLAWSLAAQHSIAAAPLGPADRQSLNDGGVPDMAVVFLVTAIYLSAIIVGVTMSATVARQSRDIALVRAVGASPRQVRRSVAAQAITVAVPASLAGIPLGLLGGRAWIGGLTGHGVIPAEVRFSSPGWVLLVVPAIVGATSLLGARIAAVRPSRVRPAVAMAETAAPRIRIGRRRTVAGLVLVVAGLVLSVTASGLDAEGADNLGFLVMLAMCLGAGFLGPALLRAAAPAARLFGETGRIGADTMAVRARSYSGALVPLTLAAAFAAVKVLIHTTAEHVTGVPEAAADLWTEYSGTAVYVTFAAVAAVNTLITVVLSRRRELAVTQLAGGTRGQVLGVVVCEALIVTGTALVVATAVALTVLVPVLHTAFGVRMPWMPASYLLTGVATTAALVLAGTAVPAALAMRRPAVEVAA